MAAEQQLLEQLVDITEPAYQLAWQLPLGAYILLAVSLLALAYAGVYFYRRWRYLAAKRQAQRLLSQLDPKAVGQINQLLKRVIRHYAPAHPALSAGSAQWQTFLQQQLPATPLPPLTLLLYQPTPGTQQSQQFYQFACSWLRQLHPVTLAAEQDLPLPAEVTDA